MKERAILEIRHYSKSYGAGKKAVDDVSLVVMPGHIYGFIGHNGAGKSTTIRAVVGVLDLSIPPRPRRSRSTQGSEWSGHGRLPSARARTCPPRGG